jgi:signal peptidase I
VEGDGVIDGPAQTASEGDEQADVHAVRRRRRSWLTEIVVLVVVALVIALTVKTYLVQPFKIPSGSMEDTLLVNDKVLVNKLVGHLSQIHRGDVVVFNGAGSWDAPAPASRDPLVRIYRNVVGLFGHNSGQTDYIKRVIGLPGDHVRCCDAQGLLTVNGVPLHEGDYLYPGSSPSTTRFSILVPPGRLWVMGDHREDSSDSRAHDCLDRGVECQPWDRDGTIPESSVIGRAFMVAWPLSRMKVLRAPATFGQSGISFHADVAAAAAAALPLTLLERRIRLRRRRR